MEENKGYIKYDTRLKERARVGRKEETSAEKHIWNHLLRGKKLGGYKFTRQKILGCFIADFYCAELKLVIEIDGEIHNEQIDYDSERNIELNKLGITVLRFTNEQVMNNLSLVENKILSYISSPDKGRCPKDGGVFQSNYQYSQNEEVSDKNILITGTSSGIGKSIKQKFEIDNNIIGISRTGDGDIHVDLSDIKNISKIADYIKNNNILIDVLVLNAGVGYFDEFQNISEENHEKILDLNLKSPIILTQKLLPYLTQNAKIIFIGSICSKKFMKYGAVYQASKFGIRGFAGSLKNEISGKKIHLINPKIVDTNFHNQSKISIDNLKKTEMKDIIETIKNIVSGEEKRFEIDI